MVHLAYCDNTGKKGQRELDLLVQGEKTMILRGAAGRKIPHSRVFEGEKVYLMEKGSGEITAVARVKKVENHVKLPEEEILKVLADHQEQLQLTDRQKQRWHKKCLCLIALEKVLPLTPPLAFDHQGNMDDWLIVEKIEDVVKGTSIPYNYDKSRLP
ncbi:MAG: hypothetical protein GX786_10380 [Clostridiales bacterium]|nr:hypothetical protein [Clostridiales bacterium]